MDGQNMGDSVVLGALARGGRLDLVTATRDDWRIPEMVRHKMSFERAPPSEVASPNHSAGLLLSWKRETNAERQFRSPPHIRCSPITGCHFS